MGAYNWILVEGDCPACFTRARIRCQTHVASDSAPKPTHPTATRDSAAT
jgi:hypothetical protein